MSSTQILDDSDPAVKYSPGWKKAGGSNEYNATTSETKLPGANATVVFVGVQIAVVGTIGPRSAAGLVSPQSNYTVDDRAPNVYTPDQDQVVHYNTRFYLSPVLRNGQHTLVVTNLLDSDSLFIDYFLVYKSTTDTVVTVTLSTASPTGSAAGAGHSSSNTGTIVGSALGAAALIVVAVAFILWLRGRNRRYESDEPAYPNFRDDRESVPVLIHTRSPSDTTAAGATQPVHTFVSTPIDVVQPYSSGTSPQTQNGTQDALPPPPRYTLDLSQPLNPIQGTSN